MKFKKINILAPTFLLAISALLSRFLGVLRDHLLAKSFGASNPISSLYDLDIYYAAFKIPDLIYNLLVLGVVSAAFIPFFTKYKKENDEKNAWEFANSILNLMFVGIIFISIIIYIFTPYLTHLIVAGFSEDQLIMTNKLIRILLLSPIIFSISSIFVSIEDSFRSFFFRAIGPLLYNGGIIFSIIYFSHDFGIVAVAWGVIFGALLNMLIQVPGILLLGYKYKPILGLKRKDVREAFKLMIPRIIGLSINQLILLVNTFIASFLISGSISIFYFADNLQAVPLGIIGVSFAISSFATLSELAHEDNKSKFVEEIKRVLSQIFFLIIPASIGILLLKNEIISIILLAGKFSQENADLTSSVLGFLAISLFAQASVMILSRSFYALHNTKTPLITAFISAFISISLSFIFGIVLNFGIIGLAIAYSIGNIINFILLLTLLSKKMQFNIIDFKNLSKIIIASMVMSAFLMMNKNLIIFTSSIKENLLILIFYISTSILVYFGVAGFLRMNQVKILLKRFKIIK